MQARVGGVDRSARGGRRCAVPVPSSACRRSVPRAIRAPRPTPSANRQPGSPPAPLARRSSVARGSLGALTAALVAVAALVAADAGGAGAAVSCRRAVAAAPPGLQLRLRPGARRMRAGGGDVFDAAWGGRVEL